MDSLGTGLAAPGPAAPGTALIPAAAAAPAPGLGLAVSPDLANFEQAFDGVLVHAEIELLKRHIAERDDHIIAFESEFIKGSNRISELEEQVGIWREKYDRLYDSHVRIQKVNQNLEDKLLQMVDKCALDKSQLTRDVETLSIRLAESNYNIGNLHKENERYKNDMNLAIQLLQCKPDNFVSQKFDSLPVETQTRVSNYIMNKAKLNQEFASPMTKKSSEKLNTEEFEFNISASLMSKILEESVQNTVSKHCDTCACINMSANPFSFKESHYSIATQTIMKGDAVNSLCLNCNSDVTSTKSSLIKPCNSPLPIKIMVDPENLDNNCFQNTSPVYLVKHPPARKYLDENKGIKPLENKSPVSKISVKSTEENLRLVNMKHKEIMKRIGDDLKGMNMNLKHDFTIPSMEPVTGHHRLCDRTKHHKLTNSPITNLNNKIEDEKNEINLPEVLDSTSTLLHDNDIMYSRIEKSTSIPNAINECQNHVPKSKSDLNVQKTRVPQNSSVSSNDAESKTSSNRSSNNYGSHSGSNSKVHIGPGPRFCSLRMQAGSKNILLDNAQPDIAPILYTRQSRTLDTSPPKVTTIRSLDELVEKLKEYEKENPESDIFNPLGDIKSTCKNTNNILDMPNEELVLISIDTDIIKPLELCEKPESGYKSNESAEIIDKLLFGDVPHIKIDDPLHDLKPLDLKLENNNVISLIGPSAPEMLKLPTENILSSDNNSDTKMISSNIKVFNFDNYESNLKNPITTKIPTDRKIDITHLSSVDNVNTKIQSDGLLINDSVGELLNSNYDLQIASKNLSEINKKFSRPPNQIKLDSQIVTTEACQTNKEWKNEACAEKSSSSLSSDDSAVILQKQQLARVAEWVQKNLEMEQHNDFDNSDGCHPSPEEMHHVRNDFPRPAKIEYRPRKSNPKSSHKTLHHGKNSQKSSLECHNANTSQFVESHDEERNVEYKREILDAKEDILENEDALSVTERPLTENNIASDLKNSNSDCAESNMSSTTTKSYSKKELARMEYNVKQFLLNGTRWTDNGTEQNPKHGATSSKTETDL